MTDNKISPKEQDKILQLNTIGQKTLVALLTHRTKTAAAQALSIERQSLYDRINRYGLDKLIAEIPKQALQTLQLGSDRAAEVLVEGLERGHDRMEAATQILDRVGLTGDKPTTLQQFNVAGGMELNLLDQDGHKIT